MKRSTQKANCGANSSRWLVVPLALGLGIAGLTMAPPAYADALPQTQTSKLVTIQGVVTDSNGDPVPGVSVIQKGTTRGTSTDINGRYTLKVSPGSTVTFSLIGMQTQEWKAVAGTHNVQLADHNKMLDEVVVVGYGTVRKADLAGSVSVLDGKAF